MKRVLVCAVSTMFFYLSTFAYNLVGEWTLASTDINGSTIMGNDNPTIYFNNDGTGGILEFSFKWEVSGNFLILNCKNGFFFLEKEKIIKFIIERQHGIDDNHLWLIYNKEGKKYTYTIYKQGLSEAEPEEYLRGYDKVFEEWRKKELEKRERIRKEKQAELERQRREEKERQKQELKKQLAPWQLSAPWWEYMKME